MFRSRASLFGRTGLHRFRTAGGILPRYYSHSASVHTSYSRNNISYRSHEKEPVEDTIQDIEFTDIARICMSQNSTALQTYTPPRTAIQHYRAPVRSLALVRSYREDDRDDENDDNNDEHDHTSRTGQSSERVSYVANLIGILAASLMLSALMYIIYKAHLEPREREIIGNRIEGLDDEYERLQDQCPNGSLNNEIVSCAEKVYLKKGAHDKQAFLRELVVATALNAINPTSQPESGIFHEPIAGTNKAKYYTMSEIKPNSMDLEDFILKGDWREKLAKKPMIGFDTALALTGVIAGQQDCKFANMIITEYEDHYEVGVIDFELSGTSYFGKIFNRHEYTTHLPSLVHYIRELHDQNDEFNLVKFKLSGDPRGREFVQYALSHAMNEENVINLYRKIAETDFITPSIARLESLYSENTGLVTRSEIRAWKAELTKWQSEALRFVQEYDEEHRSACRV